MKQRSEDNFSGRQQAGMHCMEDRMQLLETVREMIDAEFDRRSLVQGDCPPPKIQSPNPMPKPTLKHRICEFFHHWGKDGKKNKV